jgi:hypothetical protein
MLITSVIRARDMPLEVTTISVNICNPQAEICKITTQKADFPIVVWFCSNQLQPVMDSYFLFKFFC